MYAKNWIYKKSIMTNRWPPYKWEHSKEIKIPHWLCFGYFSFPIYNLLISTFKLCLKFSSQCASQAAFIFVLLGEQFTCHHCCVIPFYVCDMNDPLPWLLFLLALGFLRFILDFLCYSLIFSMLSSENLWECFITEKLFSQSH